MGRLTGEGSNEAEGWGAAAAILSALSAGVFLAQRFVSTFLDPVFEFSIFHLPSLVAALIYVRMARAGASGARRKGN